VVWFSSDKRSLFLVINYSRESLRGDEMKEKTRRPSLDSGFRRPFLKKNEKSSSWWYLFIESSQVLLLWEPRKLEFISFTETELGSIEHMQVCCAFVNEKIRRTLINCSSYADWIDESLNEVLRVNKPKENGAKDQLWESGSHWTPSSSGPWNRNSESESKKGYGASL